MLLNLKTKSKSTNYSRALHRVRAIIQKRGASAAVYSARNARKITSVAKNIFLMSLMTKLTIALTLNDHHDDA